MNKRFKILLATVVILVLIQFIGINKEVPQLEGNLDFMEIELPPKKIETMIKVSCYDCHSYETKYPWYSNLAPISWRVGSHIREGREYLNFSTWGKYKEEVKKDILLKCYKQIGAKKMPLTTYSFFHKEAKINKDEIEEFYTWFKVQSEKIKL